MKEQNYHVRLDFCEPGGAMVRNGSQERGMRRFDSRRGGILFGFLVSGLVVVCLLIACGVFLARNIRVQTVSRNGGDDVSIDTPGGQLSIRAHEKAGSVVTGVPIYPGARNERNSGGDAERDGAVRMELRDGGYKRIIGIHERHDGTHIGVASVGEPAAN
jgi:hypothetical protein